MNRRGGGAAARSRLFRPPLGARAERRVLQAAVAVGGLVPVGAGGAGVLWGGPGLTDGCAGDCDSHLRYLSGLLLAIGLVFWLLVPAIERQGRTFALLTGIVVTGGLGRLVAAINGGLPGPAMTAALAMELAVVPALMVWQRRVARRCSPVVTPADPRPDDHRAR